MLGHPSPASAAVQRQGTLSGIGDRHRRATTHVRHSEEAWSETILVGLSWLLLVLLTSCIASQPYDGTDAVERCAANRGPAVTISFPEGLSMDPGERE
jgi:hypothetical protein